MGIFGWFAINHGTESLLAVSDVFFDFSEQLPYDFAAAIQHKSRLQELTQGTLGGKPEYSLSERKGPEHSPEFSVEIRLPGGRTFQGSGKTVKQAETAAAKNALHAIGITGRHVPDAKSRFIETPLPASFDTDQRRKLEDFWRTVIQRFSDRPFDWGWALAMACSFATLNQTRPARLRARMSCFGSTVIHYYASLALVTLWRKAREASPTHAEFMPSLCSHPALERFFDQLGLQRFIVETARLKTPARRTKVETMQAIMGYLFVARGESQARNFFKEFGKPSKQGVPIHK